jgi:hypothetical protein
LNFESSFFERNQKPNFRAKAQSSQRKAGRLVRTKTPEFTISFASLAALRETLLALVLLYRSEAMPR